jgi:hypothetical protein
VIHSSQQTEVEIRTSLHVFERKSFISAYFIGFGVYFLGTQIFAYVSPFTARLQDKLICRHNVDCVYTDEHRKTIFVVLAKHRTAP